MIEEKSFSRGELYKQYKESDPQLAQQFLGKAGSASILHDVKILGESSLFAGIMTAIVFIALTLGLGLGLGCTNPSFYYTLMLPIGGGVIGPTALAGLVTTAICYSIRRNILSEQLSEQQVNRMVDKARSEDSFEMDILNAPNTGCIKKSKKN